jgi:hypothetical protein
MGSVTVQTALWVGGEVPHLHERGGDLAFINHVLRGREARSVAGTDGRIALDRDGFANRSFGDIHLLKCAKNVARRLVEKGRQDTAVVAFVVVRTYYVECALGPAGLRGHQVGDGRNRRW